LFDALLVSEPSSYAVDAAQNGADSRKRMTEGL